MEHALRVVDRLELRQPVVVRPVRGSSRLAEVVLAEVVDVPTVGERGLLEITERVRSLGLDVRAGVHTGECQMIDGKAAGITVAIGARVAANGRPSEVVVSHTVKDLVAGSGFLFEGRGEHELKGVPDRWRLYRVLNEPV